MNHDNPFAVSDVESDQSPMIDEQRKYGGVGRLAFAALLPLAFLSSSVFAAALRNRGQRALAELILPASCSSLWLLLGVLRVRNVGYRGRWLLALFLPFLTPFVLLGLFAAPEGYADHGKLDRTGQILISLTILGFVLLLASPVLIEFVRIVF